MIEIEMIEIKLGSRVKVLDIADSAYAGRKGSVTKLVVGPGTVFVKLEGMAVAFPFAASEVRSLAALR